MKTKKREYCTIFFQHILSDLRRQKLFEFAVYVVQYALANIHYLAAAQFVYCFL